MDISVARVRQLAAGLYTQAGVAARLGVSVDTLQRRLKEPEFREAFEQGREAGCNELRDLQMEQARAGNTQMLIHLGKHYLGQKDTVETQLAGGDGGPLELHVVYRSPRAWPIDADVEPPARQIAAPNGLAN
jgi:hypothetical protein